MSEPPRPSSPGPDGLRIRQTRDATVIRVFPHAPGRPWPELAASFGLLLVYGALRAGWAQLGAPGGGGVSVVLSVGLFGGLAALGWRAYQAVRRGQQVLEVYVGKRFLELVVSQDGVAGERTTVELVRVEDAVAHDAGVRLQMEGADSVEVPMARHSDEARAWMVEHLRGAGLGARRRFGHLPLEGSPLARIGRRGSSVGAGRSEAGADDVG